MEQQLTELWGRFHGELLHFVMKKVSNQHDAEDILQEIYLKVYQNLERVQDQSKLRSWLYQVTRNAIIDYYRSKKAPAMDVDQIQLMAPEEDPTFNENGVITGCLNDFLFTLPEKDQEIIQLHNQDGLKHKEISEKLDISVSTSKMRLKRAKEKLKTVLVDCCDFDIDAYGNVVSYERKDGTCQSCACGVQED